MADWLHEYKASLQGPTTTIEPTGETDWLEDFTTSLQPEPKGKIGFIENIKRGGIGGVIDKATFGIKPLIESGALFDSVQRFRSTDYNSDEAGWERREKDKTAIADYLEERAEIAERGLTKGAKVGNIVGEMIPFMVEFIATGGVATLGKRAVSKGVLKLITKTVGKSATKTVGRQVARNAIVRGAGWVTSAGIRTALTPHRSLKDFIDRRMPDIQVSPEGQVIFEEATDSPFKSAYKAIGNQFIEMASEEAGAFLSVIGGKVASKVLPKGAVTAFSRLKNAWVGAGTGRTAKQFAQKMATKAGFNGVLEEFGEERLGALMRVGAGIDEGEGTTFEKIQKALWPGAEQAFVELIAFSIPGIARAGAALAFENRPEKTTYSRRDMVRKFGITQQTSAEERQEMFDRDFPPEVEPEAPVGVADEITPEQEIDAPVAAPQVKEDIETVNVVPSDITETDVQIPEPKKPSTGVQVKEAETVPEEVELEAVEENLPIPSQHKEAPDFWNELPVRRQESQSRLSQEEEIVVQQIRDASTELTEALAEFEKAEAGTPESRKASRKALKIQQAIDLEVTNMSLEELRSKLPVESQIPSVQADVPSVQTVPEPAKEPAPKVETKGEVESTSVIALQMQETLRSHGESLNLGYTPISIQEETDKAIAFVKESPVEAKKIAFASETGDNLKSNAVRLAYADSVEKSGDMVEYARIANQILSKNRELGQAIVVNRGFTGSPIEYVKQVVAAKINQAGKKIAGVGTKKSSQKKVSDKIKSEVTKLKGATKAVQMNMQTALEFIEKRKC